MSFGKKLTIAFTVMLAATGGLSLASLTGILELRDEFDNAATKTANAVINQRKTKSRTPEYYSRFRRLPSCNFDRPR